MASGSANQTRWGGAVITIKVTFWNEFQIKSIQRMAVLRKDDIKVIHLETGVVKGVASRDGKRWYPQEVRSAN